MKYIVMVDTNGMKYPIMFPDTLTHAIVASGMQAIIHACTAQRTGPVSAGFVEFKENSVSVSGKSESLGDMKSIQLDAIRIELGNNVAALPDEVLQDIINKVGRSKNGRR